MEFNEILHVIDRAMKGNKQLSKFLVQDLVECKWGNQTEQNELKEQFTNYCIHKNLFSLVNDVANHSRPIITETCKLLGTLLDEILNVNRMLISLVQSCEVKMKYRRANGQSIPAFEADKIYRDIPDLRHVDSVSYLPGTTLCQLLRQHCDLLKDKEVHRVFQYLASWTGDKWKKGHDWSTAKLRDDRPNQSASSTTRYAQNGYSLPSRATDWSTAKLRDGPANQSSSSTTRNAQNGYSLPSRAIDPQYLAPVERHPIPWDGRTYRPATASSNHHHRQIHRSTGQKRRIGVAYIHDEAVISYILRETITNPYIKKKVCLPSLVHNKVSRQAQKRSRDTEATIEEYTQPAKKRHVQGFYYVSGVSRTSE